MAFQLPQRRQLQPIQVQRQQIPIDQLIASGSQSTAATGITEAGKVIGAALAKRAKDRENAATNAAYAKALDIQGTAPTGTAGIAGPSGQIQQIQAQVAAPDTSEPEQYLKMLTLKNAMAKEKNDAVKTNSYSYAGPSADGKGANVLNLRTGEIELKLLPEGIMSKAPPKPLADPAEKQAKIDEASWVKLGDHVNNLRQSSRSALGAASMANQRADRALEVLGDPNVSPQQLNYVMQDLAGIFQNGSPHETSMNRQEYNTLKTKVLNLVTFITANPQAANQPEIQKQLRDTVATIKNVDNKIVSNNLGIAGVQFQALIKRHPDQWKSMMDAVNQTTDNPGQGGLSPAAQRLIDKHK